MGDVKQTNFRIDQDSAAVFRKFCEDNGMSQAQGFDHIMQVVELDRAKTAAVLKCKKRNSDGLFLRKPHVHH